MKVEALDLPANSLSALRWLRPHGRARHQLFGSWEMNWMAYNYAHDVQLPGSTGKPLVYFMYPQAETSEGRVDPFDPDNFKYDITVTEIA